MSININNITLTEAGQKVLMEVKTGSVNYYKYFIAPYVKDVSGKWRTIKDWTRDKFCVYDLDKPGGYIIVCHASNDISKSTNDVPQGGITYNLDETDMMMSTPSESIGLPWSPLEANPWLIRCNCPYLPIGHTKALKYVLLEMYDEPLPTPPKRINLSRQVVIGELNVLTGTCDGHPAGHGAGAIDMDISYYTLGKDNLTQCVGESHREKIFKNKGTITDEIDTNKFDCQRNWSLWKKLINAFPKIDLRMDIRIANVITKYLESNSSEFKLFRDHSTWDSPGQNNHDIHCHIMFGDRINWDYFK